MSAFILDASYTLAWCFPGRPTANTDATLKRRRNGWSGTQAGKRPSFTTGATMT
ncbi:MAG TPA: hypothetical protein VKO18_02250 [Terriglobia bacterium]|nr:hypothetical protein [Terriglobia bacterium]